MLLKRTLPQVLGSNADSKAYYCGSSACSQLRLLLLSHLSSNVFFGLLILIIDIEIINKHLVYTGRSSKQFLDFLPDNASLDISVTPAFVFHSTTLTLPPAYVCFTNFPKFLYSGFHLQHSTHKTHFLVFSSSFCSTAHLFYGKFKPPILLLLLWQHVAIKIQRIPLSLFTI